MFFILFYNFINAQEMKKVNLNRTDVLSIELSEHKISLTISGINKISECNIGDTIVILDVKFLIANNNNSYFPLFPIIIKSNENNEHCFYMIDHLSSDERERILNIFKSK